MYGVRRFTNTEREDLIRRIVANHGTPQRVLARRFGVAQSTIAKYTAIAYKRGLISKERD